MFKEIYKYFHEKGTIPLRIGQCCRQITGSSSSNSSVLCCYSSTTNMSSQGSTTTYACPPLTTVLHQLPSIILSAVPYLLFLIIYGINPHLHILLTSADASTAHLRNVSEWESYVLPFSVHRLISSMNCTALDLMSTVPYMMHYVIPVLFPVYLAVTDKWQNIPRFYRLLGFAMWCHYCLWYLLPTAPPWAYAYLNLSPVGDTGPVTASEALEAQRGLSDSRETVASPARHLSAARVVGATAANGMPMVDLSHREGAAFARVDAFTGFPFFYNMFYGNPVPFAAFPSGHVTWPMCILMIGPPGGRARFAWYVLLVIWATLYSSHHYLFDALGAILLVVTVHNVIEWWSAEKSTVALRQLWRLLFQWRRLANENKTSNGKISNGLNGHVMNGKLGHSRSNSAEKLLPV